MDGLGIKGLGFNLQNKFNKENLHFVVSHQSNIAGDFKEVFDYFMFGLDRNFIHMCWEFK